MYPKKSKHQEDLVEMEETKEIAFESHCVDSTKAGEPDQLYKHRGGWKSA